MRFWWSDSWLIDHRQPLHLVLALYVRDAAGLGSVGDPLLPALDPRVPRADLPPVDVETAQELLRHLLEPAGRWSSKRDEEHFDDLVGQTHLSSTDPLGNVVRHRERQLG